MKSLKEADYIFYIGQTADGEVNIYKTPRATEVNGMKFETWSAARRYARGYLQTQRIEVMSSLFEVDKAIRRVDKLRESKCREVTERKDNSIDATSDDLQTGNEIKD